MKGSKTWNDADNRDGKRPESITVRLLQTAR
ncbi:MAG: Cna B-type domain-containing protein, partial [Ruminococcus sp.]